MIPTLNEVLSLVESAFTSYGYPIVVLGAFVENVLFLGLLVPNAVFLAGVFAQRGTLELPVVIAMGCVGAFLGDNVDYWLGRAGWAPLLYRFGMKDSLVRAGDLMTRRATLVLIIGRFVYYVRSFIATAAGTLGVRYPKFALADLTGALAWSATYALSGYLSGTVLTSLPGAVANGLTAILIVVAVVGSLVAMARRTATLREP